MLGDITVGAPAWRVSGQPAYLNTSKWSFLVENGSILNPIQGGKAGGAACWCASARPDTPVYGVAGVRFSIS
jgi:hypothetical protein